LFVAGANVGSDARRKILFVTAARKFGFKRVGRTETIEMRNATLTCGRRPAIIGR
jgi:hypothetical protein